MKKRINFPLLIFGGVIGLSAIWMWQAFPDSPWLGLLGVFFLCLGGYICNKSRK